MINESTLIALLSPEYENKVGKITMAGTATDGSGFKKEITIMWSRGDAGSGVVFWLPDWDKDMIDARVAAQRVQWALKKAAAAGTDKDMAILEAKEAGLNLSAALLWSNVEEDNARHIALTLFAAWLANHMFGAGAVGEE